MILQMCIQLIECCQSFSTFFFHQSLSISLFLVAVLFKAKDVAIVLTDTLRGATTLLQAVDVSGIFVAMASSGTPSACSALSFTGTLRGATTPLHAVDVPGNVFYNGDIRRSTHQRGSYHFWLRPLLSLSLPAQFHLWLLNLTQPIWKLYA